MKVETYAQSETFGQMQVLYIVNRGLASRRGRLHRHGSVWGVDFVLSDPTLIEGAQAFALTYVELASLSRLAFFELLDKHKEACPELSKTVRSFTCWLAFQRALLAEASRRKHRLQRGEARMRLEAMQDNQSLMNNAPISLTSGSS